MGDDGVMLLEEEVSLSVQTPSYDHSVCRKCKLCHTLKPRLAGKVQEVLAAPKKATESDEDDEGEESEEEENESLSTTPRKKVEDEEKLPLENPFAQPVYFHHGGMVLGVPDSLENAIIVIGEAPGRAYEDSGNYNEWKTFSKLVALLEELDILDRVLFVPVVRCYSPHEYGRPKISVNQLKYCFSFTAEIIQKIKPKAVFALGFDACRSLTKRGDDFNLIGRVYRWSAPNGENYPVIPLWGYAYVNRDERRYGPLFLNHWRRAVSLVDLKDLSKVKTDSEFTVAYSVADVDKWMKPIEGSPVPIGFDVETTSLKTKAVWDDRFHITLASISHPSQEKTLLVPFRYGFNLRSGVGVNRVWEIDEHSLMAGLLEEQGISLNEWAYRVPLLEQRVLAILSNHKIKKIGHNIKFDSLAIFRCYGVVVKGVAHDTMLMSYGLNPDAKRLNGLDDLIRKYVPEKADYHTTIEHYFAQNPHLNEEYALLPPDILFPYAADDTKMLHKLARLLERDMEKVDDSFEDGNFFVYSGGTHPTLPLADYVFLVRRQHLLLTTELEQNGVHIDKEVLEECSKFYERRLEEISKELNEHPQITAFISDRKKGLAALRDERVTKKAEKAFATLKSSKNINEDERANRLKEYIRKRLENSPEFTLNWKSVDHVRQLFYSFLGRDVFYRTKKAAPSTAEEALVHFSAYAQCEIAKLLLDYREMSKFVDGFLSKLTTEDSDENFISKVDGRIHPNFGIDSTGTSRLVSSKPNIQQIPSGGYIKRVYGSRYKNGWLMQRDYSGLEVRILALLSGDLGLREAFLNGEDVHFRTQKFFFAGLADKHNKAQRTVCKAALFGRIYGQGDAGLFELLTKNRVISPETGEAISLEECQKFNQLIDASYPGVAQWIKDAQRYARKTGYAASAFGFLRPLEVLKSYFEWERLRAEDWKAERRSATTEMLGKEISAAMRKSQNTPIQSTAADLTVVAAQIVTRQLRKLLPDVKVCNLVHDSIWSDIPDIDQAARTMFVKRDVMDNMGQWLPKIIPGYDASWIDIPIIGETEIGVNAKDTFVVHKEPEFLGDTFWIKVPKENAYLYPNVDGEEKGEGDGAYKVVDFVAHSKEIRSYLNTKKSAY